MESQQLLTQGQVFQDKVRSGAKDRKYPAEQMYQTPKHDRILAECAPWTQAPKSLILRMYGIMASHSHQLAKIASLRIKNGECHLRRFRLAQHADFGGNTGALEIFDVWSFQHNPRWTATQRY